MTKADAHMRLSRSNNAESGKVSPWLAVAVLIGIVVIIIISLPAKDTHIPPQPSPPKQDPEAGGASKLGAQASPESGDMGGFTLASSAFENGAPIPAEYTADGDDTSPPLAISGVMEGTISLALIVEDPDAPAGTWVHWVAWNIPASTKFIPEGGLPEGSVQGKNSGGKVGYNGPAPPSGKHKYFFRLYALDKMLDIPSGSTKREVLQAMEGHILSTATLVGTYTSGK